MTPERLTDEHQTCDLCGGTREIWLPMWMEDDIGRYVLRQYVGPCEQCRSAELYGHFVGGYHG